MDLLRWIDARVGRWLAYADSCLNAETELLRCQGFWGLLGIVLGISCVAALAAVIAKILIDRKRRPRKHGKP